MFAVATHSRLRSARFFPHMLRATLAVRRDLASTRGLVRAANAIAGPTELFTFTVWTTRDAMLEFMRSGAHEQIMWRWPEWLSSFWLARLAPAEPELGAWRGQVLTPLADRGGPAHAAFVAPAFASHEPRPRDLERAALGATLTVVRPDAPWRWPAALGSTRREARAADREPDILVRAHGYSLDGELAALTFWRDLPAAERSVRAMVQQPGLTTWAMAWRPLDEFGSWDGRRLRLVSS